jgi:uncharacterized phosphosugar-binding protein
MAETPKEISRGSRLAASGPEYILEAARRLEALLEGQQQAFATAAEAIKTCVAADGLVYLFGSGHSHMLAEEGHYRAGGLACVVPILASAIMLHEGATASSQFERTSGLAEIILSRYPIGPGDVVVVFSTSGVNAVPVEAAKLARAAGATVVAVTSQAYSAHVAAGRERLADVASIVLDNKAPPGDACARLTADGLNAGPISTVVGAALLNALLIEASARLLADGVEPPIYVSANMPGAAARNAALVARYRLRNPHL